MIPYARPHGKIEEKTTKKLYSRKINFEFDDAVDCLQCSSKHETAYATTTIAARPQVCSIQTDSKPAHPATIPSEFYERLVFEQQFELQTRIARRFIQFNKQFGQLNLLELAAGQIIWPKSQLEEVWM